jgi:hypothetical protein
VAERNEIAREVCCDELGSIHRLQVRVGCPRWRHSAIALDMAVGLLATVSNLGLQMGFHTGEHTCKPTCKQHAR